MFGFGPGGKIPSGFFFLLHWSLCPRFRHWPACRSTAPHFWRAVRKIDSSGSIWPKSARKDWSTAWCDPNDQQTFPGFILHVMRSKDVGNHMEMVSDGRRGGQWARAFGREPTFFFLKPNFTADYSFSTNTVCGLNSSPRPRKAAQSRDKSDVLYLSPHEAW